MANPVENQPALQNIKRTFEVQASSFLHTLLIRGTKAMCTLCTLCTLNAVPELELSQAFNQMHSSIEKLNKFWTSNFSRIN